MHSRKDAGVKAKIPGENSLKIARERDQYVPRGIFNVSPVFINEAKGAMLTDVDGNTYIDFAGGLGVMNVGHSHPKIVEAIVNQAKKYTHFCFHVNMYEPYVELAKILSNLAPGDFPKKTMLANSGAEAVENAVKIARHHTKRKAVICFEYGFHGRTLLTMSLTSKIRPYKLGFGPMAPEVYRMPYPYCYRCSFCLKYPECGLYCAEYIKTIFNTHIDPEEIAAIIIEPIAGEGGFIVPPDEYFPALKNIIKNTGILFVSDEVQSGFGRAGKFFAIENWNIVPDIITTAKSLAAGMPLSAVTGRSEVMDSPQTGGLGGTYGGNPLACAAALKVIEVIKEENLLKNSVSLGKKITGRFKEMQEKYEIIGDVRGKGSMVAIELVKDRKTKEPAKDEAAKVISESWKRGLILIKAGVYDNVIRILAPLVIKDNEVEEGLDILESVIKNLG
ncbi:MAG: 4-aminobutyrate--2-oxoglutarate transaminase [Firmicutes bacterium]|nr:4-aminobutyrate--2-oxoglutarate transaminase [Bacillota bacterium]